MKKPRQNCLGRDFVVNRLGQVRRPGVGTLKVTHYNLGTFHSRWDTAWTPCGRAAGSVMVATKWPSVTCKLCLRFREGIK